MIRRLRERLEPFLDSPAAVPLASLVSLAIGLFFVFVWAPHPWGWRGIDHYHALALALARGEPFGTTDVPWGYAYFLAFFYRLFGDRAWIPVTAQVLINALTPWLLYRLVLPAAGRRVAVIAAWLAAVLSFNTVYASTQSSDAVCTVLFLVSALCFVRAHRTQRIRWFVAAGVLAGLVPQFRPNMILLPAIIAVGYPFVPPRAMLRQASHAAIMLVTMALMLAPWVIRNHYYMRTWLPTSTHGGIQLWYGTLQTGPYLHSRAHNPRSLFASAPFPYTSLDELPIVIRARRACAAPGERVYLSYRTDRVTSLTEVAPVELPDEYLEYEVPGQPDPTTLYYHFRVGDRTTPPGGFQTPFVFFISSDHLGDLDRDGDLLDIFDVVRVMRRLAWNEPLAFADRLDLDRNDEYDERDLRAAVDVLLPEAVRQSGSPYARLDSSPEAVTLRLTDGSFITVPRDFGGRQTDLIVDGNLAGMLISRWRRYTDPMIAKPPAPEPCELVDRVVVNNVYYRSEPHEMQRYTTLAMDNISRDPWAFVRASIYRVGRLFVIVGTDDQATAHQFASSRLVYAAGLVLSLTYLLLFVAGVAVAIKYRSPLLYMIVPIMYVPLTISMVLTNMRYTLTMQPLMFALMALAVARAVGWEVKPAERR